MGKIFKILQGLLDETLNFAVDSLSRALTALKSLGGDFARLGKIITENLKSVTTVLSKHFEAIRKEVDEIYKLIVDYFKSFEGFDLLKQKIEVVRAIFEFPHRF